MKKVILEGPGGSTTILSGSKEQIDLFIKAVGAVGELIEVKQTGKDKYTAIDDGGYTSAKKIWTTIQTKQ